MNKQAIESIRQINIAKIDKNNHTEVDNILNLLLNTVEVLYAENIELKQKLDERNKEISILKGEKGKPEIKPSKKDNTEENINKQNDRLEKPPRENWSKSSKKDTIKIDRVETLKVDKITLPEDAEFKGYEETIIQNIQITTDNVLYKREKYYSKSEGKAYLAPLPEDVQDKHFGANLKAHICMLYFEYRVTENKIANLLSKYGISISEGTISNILIGQKSDVLTKEKSDIYEAGLRSSNYQQIDDTGFREDGKNKYVQIMCNEQYAAYFVNDKKNRETVKDIITNGKEGEAPFDILMGDDAGQFDKVTKKRGLCWVHEHRHCRKLHPISITNIEKVEQFKCRISLYYHRLKKYTENPTDNRKQELYKEFDELFSAITGYEALDERIGLTRAKREQLLVALEHPEVPLHNNLSENGLREIVLKRKISLGTRTPEGSKAWENYMTILATCKKQKIDFFEYIRGIFSSQSTTPRLADVIKSKSG